MMIMTMASSTRVKPFCLFVLFIVLTRGFRYEKTIRMKKHAGKLYLTLLISQAGHVFCCGIPLVVSALSLLTGLGVMSAMPVGLERLHHIMHGYEFEMIVFSAVVLLAGWGLYLYSEHVDCHDTGCSHGPCEPQKKRVNKVLIVATVLFLVNLVVFFGFH